MLDEVNFGFSCAFVENLSSKSTRLNKLGSAQITSRPCNAKGLSFFEEKEKEEEKDEEKEEKEEEEKEKKEEEEEKEKKEEEEEEVCGSLPTGATLCYANCHLPTLSQYDTNTQHQTLQPNLIVP